jgi:hypothetical protein
VRRIEARLRRLEQSSPPNPDDSEVYKDVQYLGLFELHRLIAANNAGMQGDDVRAHEADQLSELAHTRRMNWTDAERDAWRGRDGKIKDALWEFMKAVGPIDARGCYMDTDRLDVVDLTPDEIVRLVELAKSATCAADLADVADVVARVRLDGHVMNTAEFEALVLRGEIAAPPPVGLPDF